MHLASAFDAGCDLDSDCLIDTGCTNFDSDCLTDTGSGADDDNNKGYYKLVVKGINKNGCRFDGFFKNILVTESIFIGGSCGDRIRNVNSFYIDIQYRRKGHGATLMNMIAAVLTKDRTEILSVRNPTLIRVRCVRMALIKQLPSLSSRLTK